MPTTASSSAHSVPTTAPPTALSLDERLVLVTAAMTVRLDEAAVAYEVNTAHIETAPVDLGGVLTVPLAPALQPPPAPYPTPVAALLQRAHHRLLTGGWCTGALVDEDGAHCLFGAVRIEARGDGGLNAGAAAVLLDAIRREFGDGIDSVPSFNDTHRSGRIPMQMLDQAAHLADARGL
ncbi:hypothetical protein ACF058_27490 [Streptomyces sp. NPDC015501]|uniref:DUF6197 family protein n=1 Tax=unclassified Streptomyces TaxID=2593676 RepID=UPI0011A27816|nr:hypothetical protein A3L22_28835 [Streptomyces griseus subsp. griseus]